jgi:hypothetical protein
MKSILSLTLMALFLSTPVIRGEGTGREVGNGGHLVRCQQDGKTVFKVLDYFEGEVKSDFKYDLGDPNEDWETKAIRIAERLEKIDPLSGYRIKEEIVNFKNNRSLAEGVALKLIDLGNPSFDIDGHQCNTIIQIVQRKPERGIFEKEYLVDKSYWDKIDNNVRAGIALHEASRKLFHERTIVSQDVIYSDFDDPMPGGDMAAESARAFNATVSATNYIMNPFIYTYFVNELGFKMSTIRVTTADGTEITLFRPRFAERKFYDADYYEVRRRRALFERPAKVKWLSVCGRAILNSDSTTFRDHGRTLVINRGTDRYKGKWTAFYSFDNVCFFAEDDSFSAGKAKIEHISKKNHSKGSNTSFPLEIGDAAYQITDVAFFPDGQIMSFTIADGTLAYSERDSIVKNASSVFFPRELIPDVYAWMTLASSTLIVPNKKNNNKPLLFLGGDAHIYLPETKTRISSDLMLSSTTSVYTGIVVLPEDGTAISLIKRNGETELFRANSTNKYLLVVFDKEGFLSNYEYY